MTVGIGHRHRLATSTNVRTRAPLPPASIHDLGESRKAGPAISMWTHGLSWTNSSRSFAAVMAHPAAFADVIAQRRATRNELVRRVPPFVFESEMPPVDEWELRDLHTWKRTMANTMWLPCNWKVVLDNFNESYHVPTVHMAAKPSTNRRKVQGAINTNYKETRFDLSNEGHNRMIMRGGYGVGATDKEGNIQEPLASELKHWELDPEDFKGNPEGTREALQQAKRRLGPGRGYTHYAKIPDEQFTDAFHYTLFPNFAVSVWADGFHFLRARPHPTDPERCIFDNWWYASQPKGESLPVSTMLGPVERDAEVPHDVFEVGEKSMGKTIDEDIAVFVRQQKGFRSRGYKGVYLANQENRVRRYHELIDDYIDGSLPKR